MPVHLHGSRTVALSGAGLCALALGISLTNCATGVQSGDDAGSTSSSGGGSSSGSGEDSTVPFSSSGASGGGSSGTSSGGSSGGSSSGASSGGGSSSGAGIDGGSCPPNHYPVTSFGHAAAPVLSALSRSSSDPIPGDAGGAAPSGWNFYQISGAMCRDGSPLGIYVRYASTSKLMIYLEGGGLCYSSHFCDHNPANMQQQFSADPQTMGQTVGGSLSNLASPPILQKPWSTGIFDTNNSANPVAGWSMVYIPYCTGDAHFGTIDQGSVTDYSGGTGSPGTSTNNPGYHFVGFNNMQKIAGHLAATFTGLNHILLTGASAGALGAVFNATMVEETFGGNVPATILLDSAAGFPNTKYMAACLQKDARTTYGWDTALPSDCTDCKQSDGSGLINIINYVHNRYPNYKLGLIMSIHDQIFRLFYGSGMGTDSTQPQDCDSNDPNILAAIGLGALNPVNLRYPASLWEEGLGTLRTTYDCTGAFSSYFIGSQLGDASPDPVSNPIDTLHMHIFRDRFYETLSGSKTPAQWVTDLLAGTVEDVGP